MAPMQCVLEQLLMNADFNIRQCIIFGGYSCLYSLRCYISCVVISSLGYNFTKNVVNC
jgi:hypothetical protein